MHILIAEDQDNCAALLKRLLDISGLSVCSITTVHTLAETFAAIREKTPDLLILDLKLEDTPAASATVLAIPELAIVAPVVVMSGSTPDAFMVQCHRAGAMAYLHKQLFLRPGFEAFLQHALVTARMNWKRDHAPHAATA